MASTPAALAAATRGRWFDLGVFACGVLLVAWSAFSVVRDGTAMSGVELLSVPLILIIAKFPMILDGGQPETAFANVDLQQKDQQLGLRLGRELGAPLPFAALADQWLTACRAAGFVEEEWIAVYDVFRRMGGER